MFDEYGNATKVVFENAHNEAKAFGHNYLGTEHLLLAFTYSGTAAARVLAECGINRNMVLEQIFENIGHGSSAIDGGAGMSPWLQKIMSQVKAETIMHDDKLIQPDSIWQAILKDGEGVACQILVKLGCSIRNLQVLSRQFSPALAQATVRQTTSDSPTQQEINDFLAWYDHHLTPVSNNNPATPIAQFFRSRDT